MSATTCSLERSTAADKESLISTCVDISGELSAPSNNSSAAAVEISTKSANTLSKAKVVYKYAHSVASRFFSSDACLFNLRSTRNDDKPLYRLGSSACRLADGVIVYPDESFVVDTQCCSRRCANVVVEVGRTQSLCDLHDRAVGYLTQNDEVMVVVVVKIYDGSMAVVVYHRDKEREQCTVPVEAISFGPRAMTTEQVQQLRTITQINEHDLRGFFAGNPRQHTPCVEKGMSTYTLSLPRHLVLAEDCEGSVIGEEFAGIGDWTIDLYELQQVIVRDC